MWGGQFGLRNTKIYGAWNPYVYPTDKFGNYMYLRKIVIYPSENQDYPSDNSTDVKWTIEIDGKIDEEVEDPNGTLQEVLDEHFRPFICPCDGKKKYVRYEPNTHNYLYTPPSVAKEADKKNPEVFWLNGQDGYCYYSENVDNLERAELSLQDFGNFTYESYDVEKGQLAQENSRKHYQGAKYTYYPNDDITEDFSYICGKQPGLYEYDWDDCDLKMTSLQGKGDVYFAEGAAVRILIDPETNRSSIMLCPQKIFEWSVGTDAATQGMEIDRRTFTDKGYNERYERADMANNGISGGSSGGSSGHGIMYYKNFNSYSKELMIYKKFKLDYVDDSGRDTFEVIYCPIGTFYVVEDWNQAFESPQDLIHPINSGINDVQLLEGMQKCRATDDFCINTDINTRSFNYSQCKEYSNSNLTVYIDPKTMKPYEPNTDWFRRKNGTVIHGNLRIIKKYDIYYKWTRTPAPKYASIGHQITVDSKHFPGTYRLVGETYARRRADGKDERLQFELPLCKMDSNTSLTFDAAGDPATYTFTLTAMQKDDGTLMKLTQYEVNCNKYDGYTSGSKKPVPNDKVEPDNPFFEPDINPPKPQDNATKFSLNILSPEDNTIYYLPLDEFFKEDGKINIDVTTIPLERYDKSQLVVKLERWDLDNNTNKFVLNEEESRILEPDEIEVELKKIEQDGGEDE